MPIIIKLRQTWLTEKLFMLQHFPLGR